MNQETFLRKLEQLLSDLPEDERREAMEYYRCYFEDAGEENAASVLEELVSPEHVSETIHADFSGTEADGGFTERGWEVFGKKDVPGTREQIAREEAGQKEDRAGKGTQRERDTDAKTKESDVYTAYEYSCERETANAGRRVGRTCAVVGLSIALAAVIVAVAGVIIALFFAVLGTGLVLAVLFALTVGSFAAAPAIGLALLGLSFLLLAVFVLLLLALIAFCVKAAPAALRGILRAIRKVEGKRKEEQR